MALSLFNSLNLDGGTNAVGNRLVSINVSINSKFPEYRTDDINPDVPGSDDDPILGDDGIVDDPQDDGTIVDDPQDDASGDEPQVPIVGVVKTVNGLVYPTSRVNVASSPGLPMWIKDRNV